MRRFLFIAALLLPAASAGAVTVSSVSGTLAVGQNIVFSGSGFGTKSPAAPYLVATFDTGSNPLSLGVVTSWNEITGMAWTSNGGFSGAPGGYSGGAMVSNDSTGSWLMRVDKTNWSQEGQKIFMFEILKMNFTVSTDSVDPNANWKGWRMWPPNGASNYPNIYYSVQNGRIFVEQIGVESGFWSSGVRLTTTDWVEEERIFQASSAINVKDGLFTYRIDNQTKSTGSVLTRSSAQPAYMTRNYVVHGQQANKNKWTNPPWSNSNAMWSDEVYVDTTWSRCIIGDAATFAAVRRYNMAVPISWSDTSVTARVVSLSRLTPGTSAYGYCWDSNNNVNANGALVSVGGTVIPPNPPHISNINFTTGTAAGGWRVRMTGTDFTPVITITVGGNTASATSWLASTTVDFTMPAGTAGTTQDLVVFNSDGQFDILSSTVAYDAAPPPTGPTRDPDFRLSGRLRIGRIKNH